MPFPFARRASGFGRETNRLYQTHERVIAAGGAITDLISGQVTDQGLAYPPDRLERIWAEASRDASIYRPHPLGRPEAREAVAAYYRTRGVPVDPEHLLLTPGTSLAYWYAFSVLCNPGDEILTPCPSYPLFDDIAKLADVRLVPYRLDEVRGWAIDLADLEARISPRTRAIVLISPHHPTGAVIGRDELAAIAGLAARSGIPIISDEVFGEFLFGLETLPRAALTAAPLVITLGGFSKLFALPGVKLGWMALSGDDALVRPALAALEHVSDTVLPVNDIVQAAVPGIFREGGDFLRRYRSEISRRRDAVMASLGSSPRVSVVPPRGGFYAAVRVKTAGDDEDLAVRLLESAGCLVHPGFFYDLPPTHLVLSVVSPPEISQAAVARLLRQVEAGD